MLDVSFNGVSKIRLDFICLVMIILVALAARIPQEENRLKKLTVCDLNTVIICQPVNAVPTDVPWVKFLVCLCALCAA